MHVHDAILSRKSVRRFLPKQVAQETIKHILQIASRAPSGSNIQPWHVHVVTGKVKQQISQSILTAAKQGEASPQYQYYPEDWFEPYKTRRRQVGYALYDTLGIKREDTQARNQQMLRNFIFFDAPIGLFFSLNKRMATGSYLDLGIFIENIVLTAKGYGLDTCIQAAFANFHQAIRPYIPIAEDDILVCGMALGYEDSNAPENQLITEREPVTNFTTFTGFDNEAI
ncbi:nitroreductase [Entomomonas asaccharolytica]|uniref:Nitroreductase n=1 Tax=Entomomonas asaccharolytica TaxID=2785331 RepID=A0A974NHQ6_9GAMM|nr:nitroreductase [Entomomonas asaccharolytica]QQP86757.1 nitroreductase [Entomomonas asaccharolytica]